MRRQLTGRQRWLTIIVLTIIVIGTALLGKWGQLISTILVGITLGLVTNGSLHFCHRRGLTPGNGMVFSLLLAAGYILMILGGYGVLHG